MACLINHSSMTKLTIPHRWNNDSLLNSCTVCGMPGLERVKPENWVCEGSQTSDQAEGDRVFEITRSLSE